MTTLSSILNQTDSAAFLRNTTNSTVLGNISFGEACNQSSVYGNCNEKTGLDGGSIAAFTILTTFMVLGWFIKSCCLCCLDEKSNMQSADEGYETASETISEGSSVDPRDETTSVDEEAPADGNLPGA